VLRKQNKCKSLKDFRTKKTLVQIVGLIIYISRSIARYNNENNHIIIEESTSDTALIFQLPTHNNLNILLRYWLIHIYVTSRACDVVLTYGRGS